MMECMQCDWEGEREETKRHLLAGDAPLCPGCGGFELREKEGDVFFSKEG